MPSITHSKPVSRPLHTDAGWSMDDGKPGQKRTQGLADTMGFPLLYSEVANGGTVRLTHLDMVNTHLQLVEPLTPDHPLQAWLAKNGPGLPTKGLGVKRARVPGQILPGIPVWELGAESKFPGLPYVAFPGNVGGPDALVEAVSVLNR